QNVSKKHLQKWIPRNLSRSNYSPPHILFIAHFLQAHKKEKRFLFGIAVCLLSAGVTLHWHGNLRAKTLSDIDPASHEGMAALFLQERGIIEGFPDGTFKGSLPVNRVQAAKMLLLAAGYQISKLENRGIFPDVEAGSWYEPFVMNATRYGLMQGYPDRTFGPALTVKRAEFLKMLGNAFKLEQYIPHTYIDVPPGEWFEPYAGIAQKYNLFLYDDNHLQPGAPMTRDEVAWALYQIMLYRELGTVLSTPFDFVTPFPSPGAQLLTLEDLLSAATLKPAAPASGDIDPLSFEGAAVLNLIQKGILAEPENGMFNGEEATNRVLAAKTLMLAAGLSIANLQNRGIFSDVEDGSWYESYAMNATRYGLMQAYPNGTLGPLAQITRAEFLKMLTTAFKLEEYIPYTYTDVPPDAWFARYVGTAERYNLFLYDDGELSPTEPLTGNDLAWAVHQIITYKELGTVIATPLDHVEPTPPGATELIRQPSLHSARSSGTVFGSSGGSSVDTDGDGIPNGQDPDIDGDGIPNGQDPDMDGDGIANSIDPDIDGDGIPNGQDSSPGGSGVGSGGSSVDTDGD
ncbi:hypothetical protein COU76_04805, partial [Candidatus Peregrinibacteria bacterium CG10_big_fil_rev_8_21_14_0_10_49_10]